MVSIIVPTKNEAGNIWELTRRLWQAMSELPNEVIFVDDSADETPEVIAALDVSPLREVVLLHRSPEERTGGLGGAVVAGMRLARAPWIAVMDADLQHPPELLPRMLDEAEQTGADLVVASRYRGDGDASSFNAVRGAVSRGSSVAAHVLFPHRLHGVTDPMSGFFVVRRAALDLNQLQPNGFKILLEIIARSRGLRVAEVPFQFGTRYAGESKASLREGFRFAQLLVRLRFSPGTLRFARFAAIGATGLIVNVLLLALFTGGLGLYYLLGAVLATQGSTLWNFVLSERWVFRTGSRRYGWTKRATMFFVMNNAALALRGPMMFVLTSTLGVQYLISNVISLVALLLLRYGTADRVIWESTPSLPDEAPARLGGVVAAPASKGV